MILVDSALEKREKENNPVRVALFGAGYMGRGITMQMVESMQGMRLVAIYNRTLANAKQAYRQAGVDDVQHVTSVHELQEAIERDQYAVTDDAMLVCEAEGIDVIIEATGEIEFGAKVSFAAIQHGKHVVLMNAELDATLGPILKVYADKAGVVVSNTDGDQPGVAMNLFRFVKSIGYRPVLIGNIKGLLDHYRTPETQRKFAEMAKQKPRMVTSFADGTKLSMEQVVMANATGFPVGQRGMYGPECEHVDEATSLFPTEELLNGGLSDFVLGAQPGPGVFVIGYNDNPIKQQYLEYLKMGKGPFYSFYVPYHLCHLEAPLTAARAVLFQDAAITPLGGPVCETLTIAKRDLKAGEVLDGIGGFLTYGDIDNAEVLQEHNLLPMGLSEGCRLTRDISKDEAIAYSDVIVPEGRFCDKLRREQDELFYNAVKAETLPVSS